MLPSVTPPNGSRTPSVRQSNRTSAAGATFAPYSGAGSLRGKEGRLMERMSDILARTADRRARQARPPADDCSGAGAERVGNTSSPRADAGVQAAAPPGASRRPSPAGPRAALGRAGRMPPPAPLSPPHLLPPSPPPP